MFTALTKDVVPDSEVGGVSGHRMTLHLTHNSSMHQQLAASATDRRCLHHTAVCTNHTITNASSTNKASTS